MNKRFRENYLNVLYQLQIMEGQHIMVLGTLIHKIS